MALELEHKKARTTTSKQLGSEAVVRRCSVKKVLFQTLQNSQKNTFARVASLIKLQV